MDPTAISTESVASTAPSLDEIATVAGVPTAAILNCYGLGSRVYGTANETSDWDYCLVLLEYQGERIRESGRVGCSIYSWVEMEQLCTAHSIQALLCYFCPSEHRRLEKRPLKFELDPRRLRKSIIRKSSSSMNRAKVYMQKENDSYRGKKMISHSLRYLLFAEQILSSGRISDFTQGNEFHQELMAMASTTWEDYERRFRPLYLQIMDRVFPPGSPHSHHHLNLSTFLTVEQLDTGSAPVFLLYAPVLQDYLESPGSYSGAGRKAVLELIRFHKIPREQFLAKFPGIGQVLGLQLIQKLFDQVQEEYDALHCSLQGEYDRLVASAGGSKREFALAVKGSPWAQALVKLYDSGRSAQGGFLFAHHSQWLTYTEYLGSADVRPAALLAMLSPKKEL